MLHVLGILGSSRYKVPCVNVIYFSLDLKSKQGLGLNVQTYLLDRFKLHAAKKTLAVSSLNPSELIYAATQRYPSLSFPRQLTSGAMGLDLTWMCAPSGSASYVVWSLFFKFRVSQAKTTDKVLGRELHTLSKIYGRSTRSQRWTPKQKGFFWDAPLNLGVARLSKFDARVSTRFSLLSIRASSSSLTLAQTFEAGFFFPRLNITSLAWGQPGKSPSYPTPSLKSAKSVLWTPIFTLLRSKRKAMRGLQLARVLSGHRVYGGAQQSLRAHRRRNVERNSFAQVQVKRSLVFRLLARHKGNFLRTLRRKLRFGVGNKPNVLKRIVRSQGGLKKKHHGAWGSLSSTTRINVVRPTLTTPPTWEAVGAAMTGASRAYMWQKANSSAVFQGKKLASARFERADAFFKQPLIRYKPGLMRYWRAHRFFFQKYFSLGSRLRQKRLTRYIAKLSNISSFSLFKAIELSVLHTVYTSQLILGLSLGHLWLILSKVNVFVNGLRVYNPYTQIYTGDVLFINTFWGNKMPTHHTNYTHDLRLRSNITKLNLHPSSLNQTFLHDNPDHIEVDELTSTVVLLNEPGVNVHRGSLACNQFPHITFRMYNWKYST